jgi:hypothetical protein
MDVKPLFVFPRWSNTVTLVVLLVLAILPVYAAVLIPYALDPVTLNVNYQPVQPVAYSHALHVGQLGVDCRYCHNTVEQADFAAVPPTETCMNCHRVIWTKSEKLQAVRDSFGAGTGASGIKPGQPVPWRMVTTVPDYVYFSHAAHVNSGVGCGECHGGVNHMETVYQAKPMNMAWCVQCHRDSAARIRPRGEVTKLDWMPGAGDEGTVAAFAGAPDLFLRAVNAGVPVQSSYSNERMAREYVEKVLATEGVDALKRELGGVLKRQYHINPSTDCVTCHR